MEIMAILILILPIITIIGCFGLISFTSMKLTQKLIDTVVDKIVDKQDLSLT